MSTPLKVMIGVLLFGCWAIFVNQGKAPVDPFIAFIRDGLYGLGIFGATTFDPKLRSPTKPEQDSGA